MSRVSSVASSIPVFTGTKVKHTFIEERSHSWQAHLKRISCYLNPSRVWWDSTVNGYDADHDLESRVKGPTLFHFRSENIECVLKRSDVEWKNIIDKNVELPAKSLFAYLMKMGISCQL